MHKAGFTCVASHHHDSLEWFQCGKEEFFPVGVSIIILTKDANSQEAWPGSPLCSGVKSESGSALSLLAFPRLRAS